MTRTTRLARELGAAQVRRRAAGQARRAVDEVLARLDQSSGAPLPAPLTSELGDALGRDVGDVRVHTDRVAADAARDLGAEAFALGDHVYFADGAYRPDTERGRHLIAHEVAHTAQQRGAAGEAVEVSQPHDPSERDADRFADWFVKREPAGDRSRILRPEAVPLIAPVRHRLIHRFPYGMGGPDDPPGQGPPRPTATGGKRAKPFVYEMPGFTLFPLRSWDKEYAIVPPTFIPITSGTILIGKVPVTYKAEAQAEMGAFANATVGPGTVNAAILYIQDEDTYDDLVDGSITPSQIPGGASGKGTINFAATASAGMHALGKFSGEVAVFDAFAVGASVGLGGGANLSASMSLTKALDFNYVQGSARVNDSVDVEMTADLDVALFAYAGIYVELRPPGLDLLSGITSALRRIPLIGGLVPDAGQFRWRKSWDKEIPLLQKQLQWRFDRKVELGGSPDASGTQQMASEASPDLGALISELAGTGTSKIADDPGPEGLEELGNPGALASARARARGQVANTRTEIDRERKWNQMAADKLRERQAKAKASAGGGNPSPAMAGASSKLGEHASALDDADSVAGDLDGEVGKAQGHEGDENPATRAEVRTAYDTVTDGADKLGDAVAAGEGKFERPAITDDPAAERAFDERLRRVMLRFDAVADPIMVEVAWTDYEMERTKQCGEVADYRAAVAKHYQEVAHCDARRGMLEDQTMDAREAAAGGDFATANAKLDDVDKWLGWIEGKTAALPSQRPPPTWDDRYATPEGAKLMLRGPYRKGRTIREHFYPGEYREPQKTQVMAQIKEVRTLEDPNNPGTFHTYWKWEAATEPSPRGNDWWRVDILNETPTVAHNHPPVALHWNRTGCATDQGSRANFYNGIGPGTKPLTIEPWKVNVAKGARDESGKRVFYQHNVRSGFRGP